MAGGAVPDLILHASCVSVKNQAVLIRGASGSGKSALALQLMACGAGLVSDDRTCLSVQSGALIASAPETLRGMIEARGIGILAADPHPPAKVALLVDLDHVTTARLPDPIQENLMDVMLPCLHKLDSPHFPAAILQYLKAGAWRPT